MDNRLKSDDKDEEVRKLQALVKELETENEELRSERVALLKVAEEGGEKELKSPETPKKSPNSHNLENLESVEIETQNLADDESW